VYGTPHFTKPCKPIAAKILPKGDGWLHEPKFDGYRLQVIKDGRQVRLYSRGGYDWTKRLARLAEALKAIMRTPQVPKRALRRWRGRITEGPTF
jgi:ATP-dependent DNA ligase